MIRRARSVMLTTGSVTFLTFACSDGIIEGEPYTDRALDTAQAGATSFGGSTGMQPRGGSAGSGNLTAGGMAGSSAQGGNTQVGDGGSQTSGAGPRPTGAGGGSSQGGVGASGAAGMPPMPACGGAQDQCRCEGERTLCGSSCVDTDRDAQNCGSCGSKCATGATCEDGECTGGEPASGVTSCSSITDYGVVSSTIVVEKGQTYDGKCKRYRADREALGDGSQDEGQEPVFLLEDGARLINVVLGAPAADGIHTEGNVTLENITWEDVGEDALTIKESGTVVLNGGSATKADDKIFQLNAASTFRLSNFDASDAGKLIRQVGGSTFKVSVFIDRCDISGMDESIFRTDSSTSTVSMTNTRYHDVGTLFIGVSSGNISQSNNTKY